MKRIIVAIDGYSSCGKSTLAKALAKEAGYTYVDTGAMYRGVALAALRAGIMTPNEIDEKALQALLPHLKIHFMTTPEGQHLCLNGQDEEQAIRTLTVGNGASRVSTIGFVRRYLVEQQQVMGQAKGIVMDGRDIGTVVFPEAELKIFLTADPAIRAERRYQELLDKGQEADLQAVLQDVTERDYRDTHRAESPLRQAQDAIVLDNSHLTPSEQLAQALALFKAKIQ